VIRKVSTYRHGPVFQYGDVDGTWNDNLGESQNNIKVKYTSGNLNAVISS